MQLREAGLSLEKIAETLGYRDRGSAYKAVMAGLKARLEPAESLRQLELRRLDKLFLQLWPLATAKPPDQGAIDRLLRRGYADCRRREKSANLRKWRYSDGQQDGQIGSLTLLAAERSDPLVNSRNRKSG
jgi:hypothetical protein